MPRYAAFLRGVMPTNASNAELKRAFERAGFSDVVTVRASGNLVFSTTGRGAATLERRAEAALAEHVGRVFPTIIRPVEQLRRLLAANPWNGAPLGPSSKRVVTFLRQAPGRKPRLPVTEGKARIHALSGTEAFTLYVPDRGGPSFMELIERTFGKDQTTRTWETIEKVVAAAG